VCLELVMLCSLSLLDPLDLILQLEPLVRCLCWQILDTFGPGGAALENTRWEGETWSHVYSSLAYEHKHCMSGITVNKMKIFMKNHFLWFVLFLLLLNEQKHFRCYLFALNLYPVSHYCRNSNAFSQLFKW